MVLLTFCLSVTVTSNCIVKITWTVKSRNVGAVGILAINHRDSRSKLRIGSLQISKHIRILKNGQKWSQPTEVVVTVNE